MMDDFRFIIQKRVEMIVSALFLYDAWCVRLF